MKKIDIGKIAKELYDDGKHDLLRNQTVDEIAKKLKMSKSSFYRQLDKTSLHTKFLYDFGQMIDYNFFVHFLDYEDIVELVKKTEGLDEVSKPELIALREKVEHFQGRIHFYEKEIDLLKAKNLRLMREVGLLSGGKSKKKKK